MTLGRWDCLDGGRWTVVDSFEHGGARYIVARERPSPAAGLIALSSRERQVVACLALGQSTKEAAYALGISDATVRVLLARAVAKLGVRSRAALLDHPEVRRVQREPADEPLASGDTRGRPRTSAPAASLSAGDGPSAGPSSRAKPRT
jgi:DNA-binding CsgD family transcriptional regulator